MILAVEDFISWMRDYEASIVENSSFLTDLDRRIGDADHGTNMERGMKAVVALDTDDHISIPAYLTRVGMTLVSNVGGAAGPLYGTFFLRLGKALPENDVTEEQFLSALKAGLKGVKDRGKAETGDKTMVDALSEAVVAYENALGEGKNFRMALDAAAEAADKGRDSTINMVARKGRASYLGERSRGVQDPGASSTALLMHSAAKTLG